MLEAKLPLVLEAEEKPLDVDPRDEEDDPMDGFDPARANETLCEPDWAVLDGPDTDEL
jgi:hypothetical protein